MAYENNDVIISIMNQLNYAMETQVCLNADKDVTLEEFATKARTLKTDVYVKYYRPVDGSIGYWTPKGISKQKYIFKNTRG